MTRIATFYLDHSRRAAVLRGGGDVQTSWRRPSGGRRQHAAHPRDVVRRRGLKLVSEQTYSLFVSIVIPAGPERPWHGARREEKLQPTELPAGAPGRHVALVAPFTNCAETP